MRLRPVGLLSVSRYTWTLLIAPVTVQFSATLLLLPVAVRHTVAPPPPAQLCACANGAAHSASTKRAADNTCFMFDLRVVEGPARLSPARTGVVGIASETALLRRADDRGNHVRKRLGLDRQRLQRVA